MASAPSDISSSGIDEVILRHADLKRAKNNGWFFKTGPGEYGHGDAFLGLTVPNCREVAVRFSSLPPQGIQRLLDDSVHEKRLIGLLILVGQYQAAAKNHDDPARKVIVDFYLKNATRGRINNWDLVDSSAHKIVGDWLLDKDRSLLYSLAKSKSLWERRIAIVGTAAFIAKGQLKDTFAIAELLMQDTHDLIHKATGWMLREAGKKDPRTLEKFLDRHAHHMPRTMLRYSIEKFDENKRKSYLTR